MVPSAQLAWTVPNRDDLEFNINRDVGYVRNSPDNVYSANLTGKIEADLDGDRFFFNSTLLVLEPVNGSNLTCKGGTVSDPVEMRTTIALSGTPDPPSDLGYNDRVVIEREVDLQWTRPSYTGGVSVTRYEISADRLSEEVVAEGEKVSYSGNSSLVYGEVAVTAINYCGQRSQPANISIHAAAPPQPNLTVPLTCTEVEFAPWAINWMYEEWKTGVVYPNVKFILNIVLDSNEPPVHSTSSGDPSCSDLTANGTSCAVDLPRGDYNITLTLTNAFGSTMDSIKFDTRVVIEVEKGMLQEGTKLSVTVEVNSHCPMDCPVTVFFGTQPMNSGNDCPNIQRNITKGPLSPGESATFSVETTSIPLDIGEDYCYLVSLCGNLVSRGTVEGGIPVGAVIGIVVGGAALICVVVLIVVVVYCYKKKNKQQRSNGAPAPPRILDIKFGFSCDVSLGGPIPVRIDWKYGDREMGVVYPGEVEVVVEVINGPAVCSIGTDDVTSCAVDLPRDMYTISITQTNDIGSIVDTQVLDMGVLAVTEKASFTLNTRVLLIVTVTRNRQCPETQSPVIVAFGSRGAEAGPGAVCEGQQNATESVIPSGDSASFYVDAADISLGPDETICFTITMNGVPVLSGTSNATATFAIAVDSCDESCPSVGLATGIAVGLSLFVVLPVGVVLGCGLMWCLMRYRGPGDRKKRSNAPVLYEEPVKMTAISLTENQAYGHVVPH